MLDIQYYLKQTQVVGKIFNWGGELSEIPSLDLYTGRSGTHTRETTAAMISDGELILAHCFIDLTKHPYDADKTSGSRVLSNLVQPEPRGEKNSGIIHSATFGAIDNKGGIRN